MYSFTINVRRRHLALALVLLLIGVGITRTDKADAGGDPPGEGIAVVYIAVGTGFPDALGVGPGAALNGAPIILVPTNPPLDLNTSAELIRLDPRAVLIIGGTSAVSDSMEDTLVALLPNADVSRIAGTNRYKTNAAFSAATYPVEGWLSIPAAAFTTDQPETDVASIGLNYAFSTGGGILQAPVHLPHGAKILELRVWYYDADGVNNAQACLRRFDNILTLAVACADSVGSGGDYESVTTSIEPILAVVDNSEFGYMVYVTNLSSSNLKISRVLIRYELGATG
jgi:hypothetical protein